MRTLSCLSLGICLAVSAVCNAEVQNQTPWNAWYNMTIFLLMGAGETNYFGLHYGTPGAPELLGEHFTFTANLSNYTETKTCLDPSDPTCFYYFENWSATMTGGPIVLTAPGSTVPDFVGTITSGGIEGLGSNGCPRGWCWWEYDYFTLSGRWSDAAFSTGTFGTYVCSSHGSCDAWVEFSTTPAPEPSSLIMLGTSVLAIGGIIRRKL